MRSRRIMHGKRNRRSSCLKKKIEGYFGGDVEVSKNYTPTEQETYNPMDAGAQRLVDKDMNIERQKQ